MARTDDPGVLPKKAKVVAAVDLRGVPAGTPGKVVLINGLTWIRYWVRFANGVTMGSLGRDRLATPAEWTRKLAGGDESLATGGAVAEGADDAAEAADAGGVTVNGHVIPSKLIERSKAALARHAA